MLPLHVLVAHAAAVKRSLNDLCTGPAALIQFFLWHADPPLKEPVAARGNILSAAAADRAMPGGSAGHAALPQGRAADARPATAQPAKSGAGPAHVGLHVSTFTLRLACAP